MPAVAGSSLTVVSATLSSPTGVLDGRPARWYFRPAGSGLDFAYGGTVCTDAKGKASVTAAPTASTEYTMRFAGTSEHLASSGSTTRNVLVS